MILILVVRIIADSVATIRSIVAGGGIIYALSSQLLFGSFCPYLPFLSTDLVFVSILCPFHDNFF